MLRTAWRVFRAGFAGWWNDNLSRLGASLAYYTLFAIAPVLVIAIGIAGLAFGPEAVRGEIVHQVDDLIGMEGGRAVQALLKGASNHSAGVLATVIGSITFLLTATGAFLELQYALNTIWRVKPKASSRLRDGLMQRLVSFGIVVAIGFLLLVSLAVSAALAALSGWLNASVPGIATVWIGVNLIISVAVITLRAALQGPAGCRPRLAGRLDRRSHHGLSVLRREDPHRAVHRPQQRRVELRRRGVGRDPPALGVLLRSGGPDRGRDDAGVYRRQEGSAEAGRVCEAGQAGGGGEGRGGDETGGLTGPDIV